ASAIVERSQDTSHDCLRTPAGLLSRGGPRLLRRGGRSLHGGARPAPLRELHRRLLVPAAPPAAADVQHLRLLPLVGRSRRRGARSAGGAARPGMVAGRAGGLLRRPAAPSGLRGAAGNDPRLRHPAGAVPPPPGCLRPGPDRPPVSYLCRRATLLHAI